MTPKIFISATSMDLASSRRVVSDALLARSCLPVVQDHFGPDPRTVRVMLRRRIKGCDAVIHLAGECYGAEPREREPGQPRRSYTQTEFDLARALGKPVYRFVCADGFPYDAHAAEPAELRALQDRHRAALQTGDDLHYGVGDKRELSLLVSRAEGPIENLRFALRRTRRRQRWAVGALLLLLAAVCASTVWKVEAQSKALQAQNEAWSAVRAQMDALPGDLAARVTAEINRTVPAGTGGREPVALAQAKVAGELGDSVEALRRQLAEENSGWEAILARIERGRAEADAQALRWRDLQREALGKYANTEYAAGHTASAIESYRRALTLYDEQKEPLAWCDAAQKLEVALTAQWRAAEAIPLARRLAAKHAMLLGADHPRTLDSECALADALVDAGGDPEAETLYRRVLEVRERTLGRDDPKTVAVVNNLAALLAGVGRTSQAEELYRRAVEASERMLGESDPQTLLCLNNLATLLATRGDRIQAEKLFRRVLAAAERVFGPEHPNTLQVTGALAHLLFDQGDLAGAEGLFRRAYEGNQRALGDDQPITLISLYNLAGFLRSAGNLPDAERLYRRCLGVQERLLGPENRGTLHTLDALAGVLWQEGQKTESDRLFRRCLEATERLGGKNDPDVGSVAFDFALLKFDEGQRDEALTLAQEAVASVQTSLAADHPQRLWYERYLQALRDDTVAAGPNLQDHGG